MTILQRQEQEQEPAVAVLRESSFESFYRRHREPVYYALLMTLQNRALAEEAVDEGMVRTYLRWRKVRGMANPAGWTYRVSLNWARDQLRKLRRERLGGPDNQDLVVPPTADVDLVGALRSLSIDYRSVLVLKYLFDWTQQQIANALDIPVGTVKSRLAKGLEQIRELPEVSR